MLNDVRQVVKRLDTPTIRNEYTERRTYRRNAITCMTYKNLKGSVPVRRRDE